jgi:hypothetical protein
MNLPAWVDVPQEPFNLVASCGTTHDIHTPYKVSQKLSDLKHTKLYSTIVCEKTGDGGIVLDEPI